MSFTFKIEKLAIAVSFFYDKSRLPYLAMICSNYPSLADEYSLFVITNTQVSEELDLIRESISANNLHIITPTYLGHPYLLTWSHREIFKECILKNEGYTHFLYTEDDLLISKENIDYWLNGMKLLEPIDCIPAFVRFELDTYGNKMSTDITEIVDYRLTPKLKFKDYSMISMPICYQGMYLLSAKHAGELLFTNAGSPDTGGWGIREKASQGLAYWRVPKGANSRYFVGITKDYSIDPGSLIQHLPSNYALNPATHFGSIEIKDCIRYKPLMSWFLTLPFQYIKTFFAYNSCFSRSYRYFSRWLNKATSRLSLPE